MGSILTAARSAARDDVLSVRDVGRLIGKGLEDGVLHPGERNDLEKVRQELKDKLSPAANIALNRFLGMGETFDAGLAGQIFGMTDANAEAFEKAGVRNARDLLVASRTPEGRGKLALKANITALEVTDFAERADLARVMGIGAKYAAVLHGVGVNNVLELGQQDPAKLRKQIADFLKTDAGKEITSRRPTTRKVAQWIDNAKALPAMLRYAGEQGPNFNKEAFDRLEDKQKAMLLWGFDVRLPDGSHFDADNLKLSVPRRKPRQITEMIRELERSAFGGDFTSAHLLKIERVRLRDETIGYRLEFDVAGTDDDMYYEGYEGPMEVEGNVMLALDNEGMVLDKSVDVWPTEEPYES